MNLEIKNLKKQRQTILNSRGGYEEPNSPYFRLQSSHNITTNSNNVSPNFQPEKSSSKSPKKISLQNNSPQFLHQKIPINNITNNLTLENIKEDTSVKDSPIGSLKNISTSGNNTNTLGGGGKTNSHTRVRGSFFFDGIESPTSRKSLSLNNSKIIQFSEAKIS